MNENKIWVRDLPKILRKVYKKVEIPFPAKSEHGLIDLIEWLMRIPPRRARIIYKSVELKNRVLTAFEMQNLSEIEKTIIHGGNLKPYLGDLTRKIRNRSSNKNDFFSSDWGLLHLHLGADFENKDIRVSRSKRVLIARFERNCVYFIDVVDHGRGYSDVWGDTSHLKILHKNWPHILEEGMLRDVLMGQEKEISAHEYIELRNAGINSPIFIDGKTYLSPGLGIASDGSDIRAVNTSIKINKELNKAELNLKEKHPTSPINKVFLVVKNKSSVGFLIPQKRIYATMYKMSEEGQVAHFFSRLLSEIHLPTDKKYTKFVTPKRIKA